MHTTYFAAPTWPEKTWSQTIPDRYGQQSCSHERQQSLTLCCEIRRSHKVSVLWLLSFNCRQTRELSTTYENFSCFSSMTVVRLEPGGLQLQSHYCFYVQFISIVIVFNYCIARWWFGVLILWYHYLDTEISPYLLTELLSSHHCLQLHFLFKATHHTGLRDYYNQTESPTVNLFYIIPLGHCSTSYCRARLTDLALSSLLFSNLMSFGE